MPPFEAASPDVCGEAASVADEKLQTGHRDQKLERKESKDEYFVIII